MRNNGHQNKLAQLDREWEIERQQYLISLRGIRLSGRYYVPTVELGIGMAILGGVLGLIWTIIALSLPGQAPHLGALSPTKIFLLIGAIFTVVFVSYGIYCYNKAKEYQNAFKGYMSRRQQIKLEELD